MIVQIYEIQTPGEAADMVALGVDHIGSVIVDRQAWRQPLVKEAVDEVRRSGRISTLIPLFSDVTAISRLLDHYRPHVLHLCEALSLAGKGRDRCRQLADRQAQIKRRFPEVALMRSIPIARDGSGRTGSPSELAALFEPVSDWFLTDTVLGREAGGAQEPVAGFVGITGRTCSWQQAGRLVEECRLPVILAGGLAPDNVAEAIRSVRPAGVDSCTGTNARGDDGVPIRFKKDRKRVAAFVDVARTTSKTL
jgi:phosphoribosylanthranilate isomerase